MAITTNYKCNEWLGESDKKVFERMKENNPRRYQVAGLGNWGVVDGLVFENWEECYFDIEDVRHLPTFFGLDYGYTHDPTAFIGGFIDQENKFIYIWDEFYQTAMTNEKIAEKIKKLGYAKEKIIADSAEPKSNDRLRTLGITRLQGAKKGKDSIMNGISFIQEFKIWVHPRCVNFLTEISNYQWDKDKMGHQINKPIDDFNHCITGDTLVDTEFGQIPIEKLVGTTGKVYAYNFDTNTKDLLEYENVRKTRKNADVYEVELQNGVKIKATKEHLFLTDLGWKKLEELREDDCIINVFIDA